MKNDFTSASILAKMAFQVSPKHAKYNVDNFTGWRNPHLCHVVTARGLIKRKKDTDSIVFVGVRYNESNAGTYVFHSFIIDSSKKVVVDSNFDDTDSEYQWIPKKGYFQNGKLIARTIDIISVKDFFDAMFSNKETIPAQANIKFNVMQRLKVIAAIDDPEMRAFLTMVYVIFKYIVTEDVTKIDQKIINYAKEQQFDAERFLARYDVDFGDLGAVFDAIDNGRSYDEAKQSIQALGKDLKVVSKRWQADVDIDMEYLKIMDAFGVYLRNRDSDNAKDFLLKSVGKLKDPVLTSMFTSIEDMGRKKEDVDLTNIKHTQDNLTMRMTSLVKKMTGKDTYRMTQDEAAEAKKNFPDEYAMYLKVRGLRKTAAKDVLRLTVRNSGGQLIDYKKFLARLDSEGIKHHFQPGFDGLIDEDGKLYTTAEKKIKGIPGAPVTMNPDYDPALDNDAVFTTPSPNPDKYNTTSYFYTMSYKKKAVKQKFIHAGELGERLQQIRRKWVADISTKDMDGVSATIIECLYYFAARIGSAGNKAHGENTYGISTLLIEHVRKVGNDYVFKYRGKKGTLQNHVMDSGDDAYRKVAPVLDMMFNRPEGYEDDRFWYYLDKKGKPKPIPNKELRRYWKALDPICAEVGPHKLRTAEATQMAKEIMATSPFKPGQCNQKDVEEWYKEEMKKVGTRLQHRTGEKETGLTAIGSYIDAMAQRQFFDDLGLREPSFLKNIASEDSEDD